MSNLSEKLKNNKEVKKQEFSILIFNLNRNSFVINLNMNFLQSYIIFFSNIFCIVFRWEIFIYYDLYNIY